MNPVYGKRHKLGLDFFVKGFQKDRLSRVYLALTNTRETDRLLLECATLEQVDSEYNIGVPLDEGIYEAVTVRRFSQTDSRMKALARVFSKYLTDGITTADAVIGKPKTSGFFASVTAQIPFSDGQVVSIMFHSPDGNAKKIGPDDEIIAFRWLLNKRDITHVVSPEGEGDVSLEEVGKRIAQLVVKNSARFQATQKDVKAQNEQLDALKTDADKLSKENMDLMNSLKDQQDAVAAAQSKLSRTQDLLQKQQGINADLENQLAALQAKAKADESTKKVVDEVSGKTAADTEAQAAADEATTQKAAADAEAQKIAEEQQKQQAEEPPAVIAIIPESDLPNGWQITGDQFENVKSYAGSGGASVSVTRMGSPFRVLAYDQSGKQPIAHYDSATIEDANQKAIEYMNNYAQLLKNFMAATSETPKPEPVPVTTPEPDPPAQEVMPDNSGKTDPIRYDPSTDGYSGGGLENGDEVTDGKDAFIVTRKSGFTLSLDQVINGERKIVDSRSVDPTSPEYTGDLFKVGAVSEPDVSQTANTEPPAVTTLNDLLSGKYDSDTVAFGNMLDDAASQLEAAGLMDQYDSLLNQTADYLTGLLRKKAA